MKKTGFTLAEVLVTLGIIGVVAALTTPALIQNIGNAKIPPKLAKAKATFENAAQMMLVEESSNSILAISGNSEELGKELSKYMKITSGELYTISGYYGSSDVWTHYASADSSCYNSNDGITYLIHTTGTKDVIANAIDIPHNQLIGIVYVDVNGNQSPNRFGKDVFVFALFNDGSLEPMGTTRSWAAWGGVPTPWKNHDDYCSELGVSTGFSCAGSIFDNGMKIIYQ